MNLICNYDINEIQHLILIVYIAMFMIKYQITAQRRNSYCIANMCMPNSNLDRASRATTCDLLRKLSIEHEKVQTFFNIGMSNNSGDAIQISSIV